VLFFNAFELGAENCESSNIKWWSNYERSIRIRNRSLFNNARNYVQMSFWRSFMITLWYTTFIERIFRINPTRIIFPNIMYS
jgi:hypothetical protein